MDYLSFSVGFCIAGLILGIPLTIFAIPFFNLRRAEKQFKERQKFLEKDAEIQVDQTTKDLLEKADEILANVNRDKN